MSQSLAMYHGLFTNPGVSLVALAALLYALGIYGLVFALDIIEERTGDDEAVLRWHWTLRRLLQLVMCYYLIDSLAQQGGFASIDFHYFRF